MKYLLYYIDGFIKKFPLEKKEILIGRKKDCDLSLDLDSISRIHLKINVADEIQIEDLDSTNGTFVRNVKIKKKTIEIGESFNIGGMEFFLRSGSLNEFKTAKELIPIFNGINSPVFNTSGRDEEETKYITDIFSDILQYIAKTGFRKRSFNHFVHDLSDFLSQLQNFGSLFLISKKNGDQNIHFSIEKIDNLLDIVTEYTKEEDVFKVKCNDKTFPGTSFRFYSFPVKINEISAILVYVPVSPEKEEVEIVLEFLDLLAKEISLISKILFNSSEEKNGSERNGGEEIKTESVSIVTVNTGMKNIIDQAIKIAKSDVFVLIEGESGTGKELFAKLLHKNSKRRSGKFVALNCAAIPESLLESELFGHEKGAFTGAYSKIKGKLEIASGGTLVLDEIGDLPIQFQSKLLRVLQEHEFYRVGGTVPIKVDLRIVSLTNKVLKTLIREGKFREDLYYRLVHHRIKIPPLRERADDISPLINYFTGKYSEAIGKSIGGYTVQVFRAMEKYTWPGNVRQLENEIRRLVNLVDNNENIYFELLSDEIQNGNKVSEDVSSGDSGVYNKFQDERGYVLHVLNKNNWNKSRSAMEMGITYQGLHKKMKRLGIKKNML